MRIREIRESKGLSIRVLAAKAKMGYPFLCNVENGKADPSLSTLRRLAKALKVKVVELIDE
ncbi:MAG: helix-turn-helix domain-containing protein [Nitrospira sp. BO4]|jgi:transcriptional regulator with XRE-family HTH domain|nr:helix-turn-helix domain-containing protein [Nitrospira sp. BO4]